MNFTQALAEIDYRAKNSSIYELYNDTALVMGHVGRVCGVDYDNTLDDIEFGKISEKQYCERMISFIENTENQLFIENIDRIITGKDKRKNIE